MKRKLFRISIPFIGILFFSMMPEVMAKDAVCKTCKPCSGSYVFCESQWDDVFEDLAENCGEGTSVELEFLAGC